MQPETSAIFFCIKSALVIDLQLSYAPNDKLSQHQQFVKNVSTESGSVVVRLTIARDGTLIDVSMFKSSGLPALDATALNRIRQASPYPPFPPDITGTRQNFLLPLQFRRSD